MNSIYVNSVSVVAPGLIGWYQTEDVLTGKTPYTPTKIEKYKPILLPANERRRATQMVRLVFQACEALVVDDSGSINPMMKADTMATVFASSGGDYHTIDGICRSFTQEEKLVSPTQFHNSVHNSAAGYWGIATGSKEPSSSIAALDASFIMGLIEACTQITSNDSETCLLAVYDTLATPLLTKQSGCTASFASSYILSAEKTPLSRAKISISNTTTTPSTQMANDELEKLRNANPAARALPLLQLLAEKKNGTIVFNDNLGCTYEVNIQSC